MVQIGRNEPCPCGSGQKYKNCCIGKRLPGTRRRGIVWPVVIALIGVGAGIYLGIDRGLSSGLAAGGGGIMVALLLLTLRDPPPPNDNPSDGAAINFGK